MVPALEPLFCVACSAAELGNRLPSLVRAGRGKRSAKKRSNPESRLKRDKCPLTPAFSPSDGERETGSAVSLISNAHRNYDLSLLTTAHGGKGLTAPPRMSHRSPRGS